VVSRTRRECSSVGRVGALVFIGLLRGPVSAGPEERGSRCAALPGKIRAIAGYSAACMTNSAASCTLRHRSADGFRRTGTGAVTLGIPGGADDVVIMLEAGGKPRNRAPVPRPRRQPRQSLHPRHRRSHQEVQRPIAGTIYH
jgi:hypothetical protein